MAPLHKKGRPAWDFKNAADIMRLHPGLKHNFTVMQHASVCQRLFQLRMDEVGNTEWTGKVAKAGKTGHPFRLPAGVHPMSNNSRLTKIIATMPTFNAHGLDPTWAEPKAELVQQFFDNLSEGTVYAELEHILPTADEEVGIWPLGQRR